MMIIVWVFDNVNSGCRITRFTCHSLDCACSRNFSVMWWIQWPYVSMCMWPCLISFARFPVCFAFFSSLECSGSIVKYTCHLFCSVSEWLVTHRTAKWFRTSINNVNDLIWWQQWTFLSRIKHKHAHLHNEWNQNNWNHKLHSQSMIFQSMPGHSRRRSLLYLLGDGNTNRKTHILFRIMCSEIIFKFVVISTFNCIIRVCTVNIRQIYCSYMNF